MKTSENPTIDISVVLCTLNGEAVIEGAVESLLNQTLPADRYEILLVDNGSTDSTRQIIGAYAEEHGALVRTVHEPGRGLTRARNAGIRTAKGRILAFLDDDARAGPGWLAALVGMFEDPEIGLAGGPIEIQWTGDRPDWWEDGLDQVQGRLDHGPDKQLLEYPRVLYGSNVTVRREVFEKVGLFRESMGRAGHGLMAGEEVELALRAVNAGYKVCYDPAAVVLHLALPRRASMSYIRQQAYWHGRSKRFYEHITEWPFSKSLLLMPFLFSKSLAGYLTRHRFSRERQRELIFDTGYFIEGLIMLFNKPEMKPPPPLENGEPQ